MANVRSKQVAERRDFSETGRKGRKGVAVMVTIPINTDVASPGEGEFVAAQIKKEED